jgi:hypothetical protein
MTNEFHEKDLPTPKIKLNEFFFKGKTLILLFFIFISKDILVIILLI